MKKTASILIVLVLLCLSVSACAVSAPLKMRLSTRSGPGTQYDEPGTFYQSAWRTTSVDVLSKSWDSRNDIWWVQVDFTYTNGTRYRAWTGLKRVDVNLEDVPEYTPLRDTQGWTTYSVTGYYGPGSNYARFGTVPADYDFTVLSCEGNYVEIAYPSHNGNGVHRCWVYDDGSLNITTGSHAPW